MFLHYTLTARTTYPGNPGYYRSLRQHIAHYGSPATTWSTTAATPWRYLSLQQHIAHHGSPTTTWSTAAVFSLHSDCVHDRPRQPPGATFRCSCTSQIMAHPPRRGAPLRCFHYTLTAGTTCPGNLCIHCTLTGCTTGSGQRPLLHTLTECTTSRSHPDDSCCRLGITAERAHGAQLRRSHCTLTEGTTGWGATTATAHSD
eukprot:SAG31_NODE_2061_length_6536_cov_20.366941_5_plen_201_part_00